MTKEELASHLKTKAFGRDYHLFEDLDSTNSYAKSLIQGVTGAKHGTIIQAEEQTAGRGRLGRAWKSEKGKNLTFSLIVHPTIQPNKFGIISLMAGIAVAEAIQKTTHLAAQCKWPNDVFINDKKVCGILSEAIFSNGNSPAVIIGIGINVNQTEFLPDLQQRATSLAIESGTTIDRLLFFANVLLSLEHWFDILEKGGSEKIIASWRTRNYLLGKEINIDHFGNLIKGIAGDIADDGGLFIRADGEDIKVLAGDINTNR